MSNDVRVLHHELAAAQQTGPRAGLVAVLGLDLVDAQRQILVRRVQVLHEQREHLLVGRRQQEVVAAAVLQAEQVVAVLGPAVGQPRTARGAAAPGSGPPGSRPRPSPRGRCARRCGRRSSPSGSHVNPPGAARRMYPARTSSRWLGHLGVVGIVPQRAQEQRRHAQHGRRHRRCIRATAAILGASYLVHSTEEAWAPAHALFREWA